jgi:hypothetical protein
MRVKGWTAAGIERHRRPGEKTLTEAAAELGIGPGATLGHYHRGRLPGRHVRANDLAPRGVIFVDGAAVVRLRDALAVMLGAQPGS